MTAPRRLAEAGTDFERDLLASARLDVGRDDGMRVTLVALGAGALTTTAAASTAASTAGAVLATSAGTGAAAGGTALVAAGAGVTVKWIGLAALVVVAGAGVGVGGSALAHRDVSRVVAPTLATGPAVRPVVEAASRRARLPGDLVPAATAAPVALDPTATPAASSSELPPTPAAPPSPELAAAPAAAQAMAPHLRRSTSSPAVVTLPREVAVVPPAPVPERAVAAPADTSAPEPLRGPVSALRAEVATLDGVRASLAGGDASRALADLDAHDRAFPASVFAEEAQVLRVDALAASGDRQAATSLGRMFLARYPTSPNASHVERILAGLAQSVIVSASPRNPRAR